MTRSVTAAIMTMTDVQCIDSSPLSERARSGAPVAGFFVIVGARLVTIGRRSLRLEGHLARSRRTAFQRLSFGTPARTPLVRSVAERAPSGFRRTGLSLTGGLNKG